MTELENLKAKLARIKEQHMSLWETYGSELCAGSMSSEERYLEEQIKKLENEQIF
jgi:hypothetical protein